jgi:hypothetical protein
MKIITLVWLQANAYAQNALFGIGLAPSTHNILLV